MAVESALFVGQLNTSLPNPSDGKSEGDDHLRLIKATLLGTFPGLVGRIHRTQLFGTDYTYLVNDNASILEMTGGGSLLGNAASAASLLGNGWYVIVYANGDDVTIDPNGAELINGVATIVVPDGCAVLVRCNGTAFTAFYLLPAVATAALAILGGAPLADPTFTGTAHLALGTIKPFGSVEFDIGYRDVPQRVQNGDHTFELVDRGRHIIKTDAAAGSQWVIPPNSDVAFPIGSVITLVHNGSGSTIAIEQGSGVTLVRSGDGVTGNRTLLAKGLVTILKVATDVWFLSGSGVS